MNFRRMASQWRSSSKRRLAELSEEGAELPSLDETEAAIKGNFSDGCAYCGAKLTESGRGKVEMDHAVPISRGGGAGTENLRLCCHGDNAAKGPLTRVRVPKPASAAGHLGSWGGAEPLGQVERGVLGV